MATTHPDCIICNPQPEHIITETALSIATYFPRAIKKGHYVVAVKEHVPLFTDISEEQAADVAVLSLRLSKIAKDLIGAEKYYSAVVGDKDAHFHVHMLPRLPGEPPMGRHIMLDEGWKGEVGVDVTEEDVAQFIASLKAEL